MHRQSAYRDHDIEQPIIRRVHIRRLIVVMRLAISRIVDSPGTRAHLHRRREGCTLHLHRDRCTDEIEERAICTGELRREYCPDIANVDRRIVLYHAHGFLTFTDATPLRTLAAATPLRTRTSALGNTVCGSGAGTERIKVPPNTRGI